MRKGMFLITLLLGVVLIVVGIMLSAPMGTPTSEVYSNPQMPFAPGIFVIGVILIFLSPVVYELFPGDRA